MKFPMRCIRYLICDKILYISVIPNQTNSMPPMTNKAQAVMQKSMLRTEPDVTPSMI